MLTRHQRWHPRERSSQESLGRLLHAMFSDEAESSEEISNRSWRPPVDIQETDGEYRIYAELPGMKKDEIEISLENNQLQISGERTIRDEKQRDSFRRVERLYGTFARSFTLPSLADTDNVEASFEDGLLTVRVPKASSAQPRTIEVQ